MLQCFPDFLWCAFIAILLCILCGVCVASYSFNTVIWMYGDETWTTYKNPAPLLFDLHTLHCRKITSLYTVCPQTQTNNYFKCISPPNYVGDRFKFTNQSHSNTGFGTTFFFPLNALVSYGRNEECSYTPGDSNLLLWQPVSLPQRDLHSAPGLEVPWVLRGSPAGLSWAFLEEQV